MSNRWITWAFQQEVSPAALKFTLVALADHAADDFEDPETDGICWPAVGTLAAKTGLSERTVRLYLDRLVDSGHVSKVHRRRGQAGRYRGWDYRVGNSQVATSGNGQPVATGSRWSSGNRQPVKNPQRENPQSNTSRADSHAGSMAGRRGGSLSRTEQLRRGGTA